MYLNTLKDIASKSDRKILLLDKCAAQVAESTKLGWRCAYQTSTPYDMKAAQAQSQFCLIAKTERLFQLNLIEALATNCIPVIFGDNIVLPFAEVRTYGVELTLSTYFFQTLFSIFTHFFLKLSDN